MTAPYFVSAKPFALIRRQAERKVLCLQGDVCKLDKLTDIPRKGSVGREICDTLSILPFRQVEELETVATMATKRFVFAN